jgi:hypothetical protein
MASISIIPPGKTRVVMIKEIERAPIGRLKMEDGTKLANTEPTKM